MHINNNKYTRAVCGAREFGSVYCGHEWNASSCTCVLMACLDCCVCLSWAVCSHMCTLSPRVRRVCCSVSTPVCVCVYIYGLIMKLWREREERRWFISAVI